MAYQATFERYEIKYILEPEQKQAIREAMESCMKLDDYGRTIIRNIYLDTPNHRLVRRSLEKPAYKEKLRLRSYSQAGPDDPVFVELKKKYRSVVYKRRLVLSESQAMETFSRNLPLPCSSQIAREMEYFRKYYRELCPAMFLSYEREAYYSLDGSGFRVTFDEHILAREDDFSLGSQIYGQALLREGQTLMELKTAGGIPLWMSHALAREKIFRTTFSKYGEAYRRQVERNQEQRGKRYA